MLRTGLALLLICASAQAMAQNGRHASPNSGACHDTGTLVRDEAAQAGAVHPKAGAARQKYAKPASVRNGGNDEQSLSRTRNAKWHSFLPGMFR